ncbi:hypothetical protein AYR66_00880 [Noviherbaspirillum denitrificans]|uniref:Uncharacterized protein n=2 Tax=Noviherbaspirillum denitrificans TaxID=1968433 RepID=A0A254T8W5_9BURK|nr:hypothetical protein AYR66_00880 [Noviherbaspirillum denitrificans]
MLASLVAGAICLSAILGQATRNTDSRVETMMELRDASSYAEYRALEREAHAIFRATIARCRRMQETHFSHCAREAREHFYDDLSEAKRVSGANL